jgi:hypothetical protein
LVLLGVVAVVVLAYRLGTDSAAANARSMAACDAATPGMSADAFVALAETYEILTVRDGREQAEPGNDYVIELMDGSFRLAVICVGEFSSRHQLISATLERFD